MGFRKMCRCNYAAGHSWEVVSSLADKDCHWQREERGPGKAAAPRGKGPQGALEPANLCSAISWVASVLRSLFQELPAPRAAKGSCDSANGRVAPNGGRSVGRTYGRCLAGVRGPLGKGARSAEPDEGNSLTCLHAWPPSQAWLLCTSLWCLRAGPEGENPGARVVLAALPHTGVHSPGSPRLRGEHWVL